ncbi:uncharacterized protein [Clytia hemisphaerica]|uniref:Mab-21-like nucleotidyltransferase domain-containing protein n=1 Tax=Clytia hemisphaerica TaxID=252671 RepID=A0A7M5X3Z4_9CNID
MEEVCDRLLERIQSDPNVRGYKESHVLLANLCELFNERFEETELMITGSTMEKGKVVWANDVGDLDILVFNKMPQHLIDTQQVKDVPRHPGFVYIMRDGEHITTKMLKDGTPKVMDETIMPMLQIASIEGKGLFKVVHDPNGPATKIILLSNLQSLNEQWKNMGDINYNEIALFQNFVRVGLPSGPNRQNLTSEQEEERIEKATSALKEISKRERKDIFELKDLLVNVVPPILGMESLSEMSTSAPKSTKEDLNGSNEAETKDVESTKTNPPTIIHYEEKLDMASSIPETTTRHAKSEESNPSKNEEQYLSNKVMNHVDECVEPVPTTQDQVGMTEDEIYAEEGVQPSPRTSSVTSQQTGKSTECKSKTEAYMIDRVAKEVFGAMKRRANEMTGSQAANDEVNANVDDGEFSREIGIDIVIAYKLTEWPSIATGFFQRTERQWPSVETTEKLKMSSVFVVVKHPKTDLAEEMIPYCFRYSFSHGEKILCQDMNEIQSKCYRLMKLFHKSVLKKTCEGKTSFSSYHVKTAIFWVSEMNGEEIFQTENLEICITLIISFLLTAVQERHLKHFFIEQANLFQYFSNKEFEELEIKLNEAMTNLEEAFESVECEFIAISEDVETNTVVLSAGEQPETKGNAAKDDRYFTLYTRWSETYDRLTTHLAQEVHDPTSDKEGNAKFPMELKQLFRDSKMTYESMLNTFATIKTSMYTKHSLNPADARRPIEDVVMEDIQSMRSILKYVLKIPNIDQMATSEEALEQQMWNDIQSNDGDLMNYIAGSMPDGDQLLNSLLGAFK